jgi:hypothetical protein
MRFAVLLAAVLGASGVRAESALFIGDSLTGAKTAATNKDMPAVLAQLAAARSHAFTFSEAIDLGETLQTSWDAGIPQPFLTGSTKWDFVSYQEFSTLPVSNAKVFDATAIQTYEPSLQRSLAASGQVLLFENWALVDFSPFASRAADVAALEAAYTSLSAQLTVPNAVAPIGKAFEAVFATKPESYLIVSDGKHPTDLAIYLNACVYFAMIFHESPVGLPALYVPAADAAFLQGVAEQVTGTAPDAGPAPDAGAAADAGIDAGPPDEADAGTPAADAGSVAQAPGAAAAPAAQGCSAAGAGWLAALAALTAWRRNRRSA